MAKLLPRATEEATKLFVVVEKWASGTNSTAELPFLHSQVMAFSLVVGEELRRTYNFRVTDKGNLSVNRLVEGASKAYPEEVFSLLDPFIRAEIDSAGRALVFALYTGCGFHILRSVEIAIKGYVHASTGMLPASTQRNWGGVHQSA